MKKMSFILCVAIALVCSKSVTGQSAATYKSQRDSIYALYIFVLDKYDSVIVANNALEGKIDQIGKQLTRLKNEIDTILKKKNETESLLSEANKLIGDQAALLEKLEAEVKRLSQSKKPAQ